MALDVLQPETAVAASQQAANLVAKLREISKGQDSNGKALVIKLRINNW